MSRFNDRWDRKPGPSITDRIRDGRRNSEPLKPRIDLATREIQIQVAKLETADSKIRSRDEAIFSKVVSAVQKHDTAKAAMYANELSEVRKIGKLVSQSKLALEQMALRLTTITDLGDIVTTLAPTVSIIRGVKGSLETVLPEADGEMSEISNLLSGILVEAGSLGGYTMNFETANEEAEKAMEEAAVVAEQRMREKFPSVPTSMPAMAEGDLSEGSGDGELAA